MIRVLVVDDSAYNRTTLSNLAQAEGDIEVVGTARDGLDAIRKVRQLRPDVITLDLEMPEMDGLSFLRWLMRHDGCPVLVVTSRESNYSLFEALELGAVDFVLKPGGSGELPRLGAHLCEAIRAVARLRPRAALDGVAPSPPPASRPVPGPLPLVTVAASTGGPRALQALFRTLPRSIPAAFAVVQHMPPGFTASLAARLAEISGFQVQEARDGATLGAGSVLVAPGGSHFTVVRHGSGYAARIEAPGGEWSGPVPSADRLMESAAAICGSSSVGVVLTGMGSDGACGLMAIRDAGGQTLAEAEESSIVYGMPRSAMATGAVQVQVPLDDMTEAVCRAVETVRNGSWMQRAGNAGVAARG